MLGGRAGASVSTQQYAYHRPQDSASGTLPVEQGRQRCRHKKKIQGTRLSRPTVKLLDRLDRLLHFGGHCVSLRRKVRGLWRANRTVADHVRTVANGCMYVRGVLKHAESVCSRQRLDISHGAGESRAACCDPCGDRLPPVDPDIRGHGGGRYGHDTSAPRPWPSECCRSRPACHPGTHSPWRWCDLWREVLVSLGISDVPVEPALEVTLPPWTSCNGVSVSCEIP